MQAKVALTEVFHRIDLDNTGALRRREYDLLLLRTDGEACDDETWEYMTGISLVPCAPADNL